MANSIKRDTTFAVKWLGLLWVDYKRTQLQRWHENGCHMRILTNAMVYTFLPLDH